jgi:DNA-binding NarL/FixJ family response regulator
VRDDIRDDIVSRIKLKLGAKKLHWLADANRRHTNEIETQEHNIKKSPDKPAKPVEGKLPPKRRDLTRMFGDAKLTDRQTEIASLAWEYGLSKVQIARRLGRDRKTIDESLASSQKRIDRGRMKTKSAAKQAKFDPDNQG